jgi:hypothetical protein
MRDIFAYLIVFALGCVIGYGVREWKSRKRRRPYLERLH